MSYPLKQNMNLPFSFNWIMPLDTGCLPDTLLTIGRSDSRTFLFMAICYTHSHTTKKQKLKSTSGSILLLEGDLFLFAVSFILVWICLGSSKTVVAACELAQLAQYAPSLQFLPVYQWQFLPVYQWQFLPVYQWASPNCKMHPTPVAQNIQGSRGSQT